MKARRKASRFQTFALAASLAFVLTPIGQFARAETFATAPTALTANIWAGTPANEPAVRLVSAPAAQPAQPAAEQLASAPAQPARDVRIQADTSKVSEKVRQQAGEKAALQDRIRTVPSIGGVHAGDPVDQGQPALSDLAQKGTLKITPDSLDAYAYVQPYREPDDSAHRNYCGPGSATELISHFDGNYPQNVNIDELGASMGMDPDGGVWVKDMVGPVNREVNRVAGQDVNWYRHGQARSLEDMRYMLDVDVGQNGVPLITSLMTGGLPGWGSQDVGHIVAVYGYHRDPSGTEWVLYADTAGQASGYSGPMFHMVDMATFWHAVSGNSAQVW